MPDPHKTPPLFRPHAPPSPSTPFCFNPVLAKAIPAGNYLILRGVYVVNSKKIKPVALITAKVSEIWTSNSSVHDIPINIFPINIRDTSTSCYAHLHPSMDPINPSAEPCINLLSLWIHALRTTRWEVFEHDGYSLLLDTRVPRSKSNYLVISMIDWEATHCVLTVADRFLKDLGQYNLSAPQLLCSLNTSTAWRHDPAAAIAKGTDKLSVSFAALIRHIEQNEHDARACNADTKACITAIDATVATVTNVAATVAHHREDLARSLFQLQQGMQITLSFTFIDSTMLLARCAIARPVNIEEEKEVRKEFKELKTRKTELTGQLNVLKGASILSASPTITPLPHHLPHCRPP
ncbi:hypothetical protein B0H17DRAFT_1195483 [Mycena rosella]|uniref:Uncharacterized protein n=1 Tax=Mycena rosella TaxID=1033263 RepID=A0AAD7DW79_MYCRO|nr:hypothetical protein B0H17DRAFT_1195483 [Mycena rosella]